MIRLTLVPLVLLLAASPVLEEQEQRYPVRAKVSDCFTMRIVKDGKVVKVIRGDATKAESRERDALSAAIKLVKQWEKQGFATPVEGNQWTERTILLSPVFEDLSYEQPADQDSKGPTYPRYSPSRVLRILHGKRRFCVFNRQSWDVGATTSREWPHGDPGHGVDGYQGDGTLEVVGHPGINVWSNIIPRQFRGAFLTKDLVLLSSTLLHEATHLIAPRNDATNQDPGRFELDSYRIENLALYRYYVAALNDPKSALEPETKEAVELQVRTINQKLRGMCRTQYFELPDGAWEPFDCGCAPLGKLSECDYCSSQIVISGEPPKPGEWGNISLLEEGKGVGNLSDYKCDRALGRR